VSSPWANTHVPFVHVQVAEEGRPVVMEQGRDRPATQAPPGWFRDPTGNYAVRYWDGDGWTEHVSRAGRAARDPIPDDLRYLPPPPGSAVGSRPEVPATSTTTVIHETHRPSPVPIILSLAVLAIVIALAALVLGNVGDSDRDTAGGGVTPTAEADTTTGDGDLGGSSQSRLLFPRAATLTPSHHASPIAGPVLIVELVSHPPAT
jgi:hypothetical protein